MLRRLSLWMLLASSLAFLASLFLPWIGVAVPPARGDQGVLGLLDQFAGGGGQINGWVGGPGDIAVLLVIAIVIATIAAFRRPHLAARLPIGALGVALGYFAVAVAVQVHAVSPALTNGERFHTSWVYGFYLGLASAGVALLSALAYRGNELWWPRGAGDIAAAALGVALLVSFLLPWYEFPKPESFNFYGIMIAAAVIAAPALILGARWLHREAGRRWRLPFAIAVAVLTAGAADAVAPSALPGVHRYGTWIAIGCAVSLVALEAARPWPVRLPVLPRGLAAVRLGAAALLIVALFLPWQEVRMPPIGAGAAGWYVSTGAAAGALCLLLLASPALPKLESYVLDAVVAIVIFVSALATYFRADSFAYRIGYGAFVGVAAAATLLVTVFVQLRPGRANRSRALVRAIPLALSVLCVAAVVIPSWFVLPEGWRYQAAPLASWLAVTGVLLGLYLVRLWALQVRGPSNTGARLTLVPLVLLALPSLELIRVRNEPDIQWGAIVLIGLCLLLAVFGWVEENRGLEGLRVPEEIWRVDRLPGAES